MATTALDLFRGLLRADGHQVDLSEVRVYPTGVDALCRALGARALTIGEHIYFRDGAFAPHTREGLRLLAHEAAHVVQQRRGPVVGARPLPGGLALGPADGPAEREADAAADAVLEGRPFQFAPLSAPTGPPSAQGSVVQRYMAWEHGLLGDLEPDALGEAGFARVEEQYALLERLGRNPLDVDEDLLRAKHPGVETLRLPGSGLVVTLGELNILPDYLSHPQEIETASAAFLVPVVQSIRTWSIRELRKAAGTAQLRPIHLPGALEYPRLGVFAELHEALEVDALGRRCGFEPWQLYSSVVGRNAGHFAPFSWYRWQSFHLMARELIGRAANAPEAERDQLRDRARIYAGYADHFLQDSFAAGHLINKTLIMQWYLEWLRGSPLPYTDRRILTDLTVAAQPFLHGPDAYDPLPDSPGGSLAPRRTAHPHPVLDPQTVADLPTLDERVIASGVIGGTADERHTAYAGYLAMLGSSVAQLAAGIVHGHLNKTSLMVGSSSQDTPYRLQGDRTLLRGDREGARRAAAAAAASRLAIADLLRRGGTDITVREIFEAFPDHVVQDRELIPLRQWHETGLRRLCFDELFRKPGTRAMQLFLSVASQRFGVPSPDASGT